MIPTLILTLASASSAAAHKGCGGHEGLGRRNELITGLGVGAGASVKFGKRDVDIDTGTFCFVHLGHSGSGDGGPLWAVD